MFFIKYFENRKKKLRFFNFLKKRHSDKQVTFNEKKIQIRGKYDDITEIFSDIVRNKLSIKFKVSANASGKLIYFSC